MMSRIINIIIADLLICVFILISSLILTSIRILFDKIVTNIKDYFKYKKIKNFIEKNCEIGDEFVRISVVNNKIKVFKYKVKFIETNHIYLDDATNVYTNIRWYLETYKFKKQIKELTKEDHTILRQIRELYNHPVDINLEILKEVYYRFNKEKIERLLVYYA